MNDSFVVASRFCGPSDSGNGGYVCGLIANYLDGLAEVTLRLPAPLERPLAVQRDDHGSLRVLEGQSLIAEATGLPGGAARRLPGPVSVERAHAARARSQLRTHPELHPFPLCFVCGPDRASGEGMRICLGPVPGTGVSADVWCPGEDLVGTGTDGQIRPEFIWAALDCAGGLGALWDAVSGGARFLLGRLSVRQLGEVRAGEPHVVVGWRLAAQDRKVLAGSALFTASGQAVAVAEATWIRLRCQAGPPGTSQEQMINGPGGRTEAS
jgi:hypothetical protein